MFKKEEEIIKGHAQAEWEKMMVETGMDKLELDLDKLSLMRMAFELGHNSGQTVMLHVLRDVYQKDADAFENIIDPEVTILQ